MSKPIQRSDSRKAIALLPQGHVGRADPESEPLIEGGEAIAPLPQGQFRVASSAVDILCAQLAVLQADRLFAIRRQIQDDNSARSYIATRLGYTSDPTRATEAERKRITTAAKRIKKAVENGAADALSDAERAVAALCAPVILRSFAARQTWDEMREQTEEQMRRTAREFPVYGTFVEGVRGLTDLGLAVIVAEAGRDLSLYPKKGHLWKRLGFAVEPDGVIQGRLPSDIPAEERAAAWTKRGYKPGRRAEIYAFLEDVMFRSQWCGDRDEDGKRPAKTGKPIAVLAHAIGPYGAYYARKKAEYLERYAGQKGGIKHADNGARRYMAKMLIRDLLSAWRAAGAETWASTVG